MNGQEVRGGAWLQHPRRVLAGQVVDGNSAAGLAVGDPPAVRAERRAPAPRLVEHGGLALQVPDEEPVLRRGAVEGRQEEAAVGAELAAPVPATGRAGKGREQVIVPDASDGDTALAVRRGVTGERGVAGEGSH